MVNESSMVVAKGSEENTVRTYCLMGRDFQFGKMNVDGGDGCITISIYLRTLLYIHLND